MVKLLLIILLMIVGNKVIYQNNFAILEGSISMPAANDSSTTGTLEIEYPDGFNQTNCVVISVMSKRTDQNGYATTMSSNLSASNIRGNGDTYVTLLANTIKIQSEKTNTGSSGVARAYKIVLMKV